MVSWNLRSEPWQVRAIAGLDAYPWVLGFTTEIVATCSGYDEPKPCVNDPTKGRLFNYLQFSASVRDPEVSQPLSTVA